MSIVMTFKTGTLIFLVKKTNSLVTGSGLSGREMLIHTRVLPPGE